MKIIEKRKMYKTIVWGIMMLVVLCGVIHYARINAASWDEGLTYSRYVRGIFYTDSLKEKIVSIGRRQANNHLLNTILMGLCDFVFNTQYDEFVMRVPNIVFYVILACVIGFEIYNENISLLKGSMLILAYPIVRYFYMARGYGISFCLSTMGIIMFDKWMKSGRKNNARIIVCMFILSIANFANTIALLFTATIGLAIIFLLIKDKTIIEMMIKYRLSLVIIVESLLLAVCWHFWISADGALFTSKTNSVNDFLGILNGYCAFWIDNNWVSILLIGVTVLAACISAIKKEFSKTTYVWLFILYCILCVMFTKISKKGYPTERVLIPSFGLYVFAVYNALEYLVSFFDVFNEKININTILKSILFLLFVTLFLTKMDWKSYDYVDGGLGETFRNEVQYAYKNQVKFDREKGKYKSVKDGVEFYRQKMIFENGYDIYIEEN